MDARDLTKDATSAIEQGFDDGAEALIKERREWPKERRDAFEAQIIDALKGLRKKVADARRHGRSSCQVMRFAGNTAESRYQRHVTDELARILARTGFHVSLTAEGATGLMDGSHDTHVLAIDFSDMYAR